MRKRVVQGLCEVPDYKQGNPVNVKITKILEPIDIGKIRRTLYLTQKDFAERIGVSIGTLRNWEQGRRKPHGPAQTLLILLQSQPEQITKLIAEIKLK